jgi:hypothetical protein
VSASESANWDAVTYFPSDAEIAGLIRRLRGWPADTPIPPFLIREFRSQIWNATRRQIYYRRNRRPPPELPSGFRRIDVFTLVDFLNHPHSQVLVALLAGASAALTSQLVRLRREISGSRGVMCQSGSLRASGILAYARGKIGDPVRTLRTNSPYSEPPSPWHVAAINAMSKDTVRGWIDRLESAASISSWTNADQRSESEIGLENMFKVADRQLNGPNDPASMAALAAEFKYWSDQAIHGHRTRRSESDRQLDAALKSLEESGRIAVQMVGALRMTLCSPEAGEPRGLLPDEPIADPDYQDEPAKFVPGSGLTTSS